ncbi:MAG: hypothetical protein ACKOF9_07125 [Burkholderiales bacterium]
MHPRQINHLRALVSNSGLLDWGCFEHLPGGNERVSFRKRDLDKLHKSLPKPQWLAVEKQRKLYAVLDGGTLITIGHRHGHMKRK